MALKLKSWVWEHFTNHKQFTAECKICGKELCKSGTSSMSKHLRVHDIYKDTRILTKIKAVEEAAEDRTKIDVEINNKTVAYSPDNCYVCNAVLGAWGRNDLVALTGFTNSPVYDILGE